MLDEERLGALDRLVDLTLQDAADRVRRHHPGAPRDVVEAELAGELRRAGLTWESLGAATFRRAVDALCPPQDERSSGQRSTDR